MDELDQGLAMARELLKLAAKGKAKVVGRALARAARSNKGSASERAGQFAASLGSKAKGGLKAVGDVGESFARGAGAGETGKMVGRHGAQAAAIAGAGAFALGGRNKVDEWRYNHNFGGRYAQQGQY